VSSDRILTTHTGSLPRSVKLVDLLLLRNRGELTDFGAFDEAVRAEVVDVVRRQASVGLDVVNDGELSKASYYVYPKDRLNGFGRVARVRELQEDVEFPEFAERLSAGKLRRLYREFVRPSCDGPISWKDFAAVETDIQNLRSAVDDTPVLDAFMTAASPGLIANFLPNQYYPSDDDYLAALVDVMREEYEAIVGAGFILQLDCPDLAFRAWLEPSLADHRRKMSRNIDALNEATRSIPPQNMRMHVCWGNLEGPHNQDVPLRDIVDIVLAARPAGLVLEAANPRHEHEWKIWKEVELPSEKVLIPGVIDSLTNFVEHPELVADRIVRYASVVGRERVIAGVDCGLSSNVAVEGVDPRIAWAKLRSLAEGAALASEHLW
jgi:5-methyltetrahydropteroyltriglutamate--homocysteine methyltransferase